MIMPARCICSNFPFAEKLDTIGKRSAVREDLRPKELLIVVEPFHLSYFLLSLYPSSASSAVPQAGGLGGVDAVVPGPQGRVGGWPNSFNGRRMVIRKVRFFL